MTAYRLDNQAVTIFLYCYNIHLYFVGHRNLDENDNAFQLIFYGADV